MHGDTLCTGDVAYQAFRAQTRDPAWQARFLSQPLDARAAAGFDDDELALLQGFAAKSV